MLVWYQVPRAVYDPEVEIDGDATNWWQCEALHTCNLARNALKHLPEDIAKVESLQVLDVSDNELDRLPQRLPDLPHLKVLDVRGNRCVAVVR